MEAKLTFTDSPITYFIPGSELLFEFDLCVVPDERGLWSTHCFVCTHHTIKTDTLQMIAKATLHSCDLLHDLRSATTAQAPGVLCELITDEVIDIYPLTLAARLIDLVDDRLPNGTLGWDFRLGRFATDAENGPDRGI